MKVMVYVEGPSDKLAMQELLHSLLEQKRQAGIDINFFETPEGDRKASVLTKVPIRAIRILQNNPDAIVIAMPDLYPRDKAFKHSTERELEKGILQNFEVELKRRGLDNDPRLKARFKVFCFKHDLEVLILAAEEALESRLGSPLTRNWKIPVEYQNHNNPPKRVVEKLFESSKDKYKDTIDAPLILGATEYRIIKERCPQCFKPFVEFLEGL